LDATVESVSRAWSRYDVTAGVRSLIDFCDNDLSNWYVRINRARFWAPDSKADPAAAASLYEALVTVSRLLAPAAPFLSDAIHRRLTGESVHLASFPEWTAPEEATDRAVALEGRPAAVEMDAIRRLASLARSVREDAGLRVRQPLAEIRLAVPKAVITPAFDECLELLKREVNVKAVSVVESDAELVRLTAKPNFRTLGKVYGKETQEAAQAAAQLTTDQLRELEDGNSVSLSIGGRTFSYRPEDVVVKRKVTTDWLVQSDGPYVVALNPSLDHDLKQEGVAREIVNRVQRLRKQSGYDYTTRIALSISGDDGVVTAAEAFRAFIAGEVLAQRFEVGGELSNWDVRESVDIDGDAAVISLERH
jgi:isoleucyl-tRNA synthetase